ncbi:DUF1289 domain-containing protein [Sandarakinorhabdus sp. AAP62]|uniref:DUF1289 domain-containing protein n=1 Tax=Sandarakinorhabdus sp. AAP62 TaxID=1248916 RepID=UPI00031B6668|nr:DUF1289 domain-containing protein [Sandarakinorhabdus sp. AAP62]
MSELRSVASPCTNVCRIDRRTGWCEGCKRSMDEISRWPHAGDDERRAILAQLPARVVKKGLWR